MLQQILRQLENLSEKIRNPFYLGQIYIIYVQTLIILDKYVEAQHIIEQLFRYKSNNPSIMNSRTYRLTIRVELSNSQQTFLQILECKIIAMMQSKMVQQTQKSKSNQQTISLAMRQLSIINLNTIDVQTMFLNVLISKIEFFNIILNDKIQQNQLNRKVQKILLEMETLLQKLKQNYELFPTISNQSVLMFYQVEVLNNVLDAYNFSQIIALDEDIILKHNQSELFNLFNQSFNFVLFKILDVQNILIEYHSITQGQQYFKIKEGDQLQTLIPQSLKQQHQFLVENFLETGQNKLFQSIGETFIKIRQGIMQPIEICMDLNQKNSQNIEIITVYRSPQCEKHIIFVDSNFRLQEISHNLFYDGLNLPEIYLDQIIGININKVIPQFKKYIEDKTYDIKICPINFINFQEEDDQKDKAKTQNYLDEIHNITAYSCHLTITQRFFQENQHIFVLRLDNLKLDKVNLCNQFRHMLNSENPYDIDEQIVINLPDLEEEYQKQQIVLNTERHELQIDLLQDNNDFKLIHEKKYTETSFLRFSNKINKRVENFTNLSSIAKVKRSHYYQIFSQASIILNSKNQSKNWIALIIIHLIYLLVVLIFSIIVFDETFYFKKFISHLELLSIKNEVYQPIDSFLLTRFTIVQIILIKQTVSYNQLLNQKMINEIEHAQFIQFPKQNLLSGYDFLKQSITKVLYIPEFQPFLKENYLILSLYEKNNTGVNYNISFRESIHLLLNYQYEYKLAYTVKTLLTDGPYFYYSYKNSLTLYKKFVELENFTLEQLLIYSNEKMNIIRLYITLFGVISFILIILKIHHLKQIRNTKNKILSILKNQDVHQVELEIIRLQQLNLKMQNSRQMIYGYSMDLDNIDKSLKKKQSNFKYRQINNKKLVTLNIFRKTFAILFHYLIYFLIILSFYIIAHNQIRLISNLLYQNVAKFYQKISDASVNILIVYAWKEALYYKASFPFFTSSEISDLYQHVEGSLDSLKEFNQDLLQLDSINEIFGQSNQIVEKITQMSVCDNLSEEYKNKASGICEKVMQGALKGGLVNALSYVINSISNEYETTHFDTRQSQEKLELEGSTLLSDVLSKFSGIIKEQFQFQITEQQSIVYIIVSLYSTCIKMMDEGINKFIGKKIYLHIDIKQLNEESRFVAIQFSLIQKNRKLQDSNLQFYILTQFVFLCVKIFHFIQFPTGKQQYSVRTLYLTFEIASIFYLRFISNSDINKMILLQKFIYLIPQGTLFFDDQFQREIKRLMLSGQIV